MDWSTINEKELSKLPIYKKPPTYRIQRDPGNGCFLDPPGYPTYFTRSIYTMHGNTPGVGPTEIINHRVTRHNDDWNKYSDWDTLQAAYMKKMRRLWVPPAYELERVQTWISYVEGYFKNCYVDPRPPEERDRDGLITGPPEKVAQKLGWTAGFPDEVDIEIGLDQTLEAIAGMHQFVHESIGSLSKAVDYIRQWYPQYKGGVDGGYGSVGNWWETQAEKPTPETCKPRCGKHPMNITWCQWCGWKEEDDELV